MDSRPSENPTSTTAPVIARVTFDDLGGGSPYIFVYPDPYVPADQAVWNGRYPDGEAALVDCFVDHGRRVTSDTRVGEREKSTDDWVHIAGSEYFATLVYIEESGEQLRADLPECEGDWH